MCAHSLSTQNAFKEATNNPHTGKQLQKCLLVYYHIFVCLYTAIIRVVSIRNDMLFIRIMCNVQLNPLMPMVAIRVQL